MKTIVYSSNNSGGKLWLKNEHGAGVLCAETSTRFIKDCTHSGLLIGYQPIESQEPVSKSEIEKYLNHSITSEEKSEDLLRRILKNGVSK